MFFSNAKTYISKSEIIDNKRDNDNSFIITSTEKLSQKYNFDLLAKSDKAFNQTNIYSFNNFISNLYESNYNSEVIDELQYNNLIINSLSESDNKDNYNFIKQVGSQINGLRRDGITSKILFDNLNEKANKEEFDSDKLQSIAKILHNYEDRLLDKGLTDLHLALKTLTEEFENKKFFENQLFIFDEFILFSQPELEFLEALSKSNTIIVNTNWNNSFTKSNMILYTDLKNIGLKLFDYNIEEQVIDCTVVIDKYSKHLKELSINQTNIELYNYSNIREEVYGVTQLVKHLLLKENYLPSEICVVSRQSDDYSQLFKEFFADNKIPTNINDRLELSKSPVISSIVNVLEAIVSDFNFASLENVLAAPYLDLGISNKSNILSLAKKFRIIGGIPGKGFVQFLDILRTRIELYKKTNQDIDDFHLNLDERNLYSLNEKFEKINSLFKDIDQVKEYTTSDFVKLLYTIISRFKVKKSILELDRYVTKNNSDFTNKVYYTEKIESDSRALYKFTELIDKLASLDMSNSKQPLFNHVNNLKGLLSITKFQIREKKKYGVDITSIEQVRGLDYKVKILVGAVENKLPLPFGTDKLFGLLLPDSEERHYYNEFMQFYDFIDDDTKKYIFRYHKNDAQLAIESQFISYFNNNTTPENEIESTLGDINPTEIWQKSIINRRDTIDSFDTGNEENNERLKNFKNSGDLNVCRKLTEEEIDKELSKKVFNISELNSIKFDKHNHFYERILKLENSEDIEIYFTRLELGNIIHKVTENTFLQFKALTNKKTFVSKGKQHFESSFKIETKDKAKVIDLFKMNLKDTLGRFENKHKYYELERFYLLGDDNQQGLLVMWFEELINEIVEDDEFSILALEYNFDNVSIELNGKQIKFKGKVDRIDISDDMKSFKIIDYKTSESSTPNNTQLIVYSEIVIKLLKECGYEVQPEALQYFYFNYKENYKSNVKYGDKELEKIYKELVDLINLNYSAFTENKLFMSKEVKLLKRD